jgi:protein-S-isoprenylcysteine O-methyltransferase Ste14
LALLKPTLAVALASVLAALFLVVQAFLEEIDLLQRLPAYREFMEQVPRFFPRHWARKTNAERQRHELTTRHV